MTGTDVLVAVAIAAAFIVTAVLISLWLRTRVSLWQHLLIILLLLLVVAFLLVRGFAGT